METHLARVAIAVANMVYGSAGHFYNLPCCPRNPHITFQLYES